MQIHTIMLVNGFLISTSEVYDLIKSVYSTTDSFANEFDNEYPSVSVLTQNLAKLKSLPGSIFLVAQDGDNLLGYIFIHPKSATYLRHTADLNMGITLKAQGQGLGKKLLEAALVQLRAEKIIEIVYLMVRADNTHALKLYSNCGFNKIATLEGDTKINDEYFDGIIMRKIIVQRHN